MATPGILDFTQTRVQNAPSGRRQLGIEEWELRIDELEKRSAVLASAPVVSNTPGPRGPAGATGATGPAGPAAFVPTGAIAMWNGPLAAIPAGWAFCDGTNGTPDLRGKFLVGTQTGVDPGSIIQF